MIESNRQRRAQVRAMTRSARCRARAERNVATGMPQPARTWLTACGLPDRTAHRFSSAFSRAVTPTATRRGVIKTRGRATKAIVTNLYDWDTFAARLAIYRPKDAAAAQQFTALAYALAA